MKAMIWKECRENFKWAAMLCLGVCAAMAYVLYQSASTWNAWSFAGVGIGNLTFQAITVLGCPVAGLLLGLLQILPERRRDQWACLVHRPASQTTILHGKIVAGAGLYLLAVALPFAVAAIWSSRPGRFPAPFYWQMALPGVADILCGLTYYLAGILIGVRDARWFGSRLLPVGLALVCSLFVVLLAAFWQAVVAIIVVDGILWVAAGGSFVSSGIFASMSGWSKAALGLAVLVGIVLVGYVTMAILAAAVSSTHHESRSYMFTKSGDVIVELRHGRHMETVSHVDLQGTAVEEVELWSGAYLATGDRMTMRSGFDHYRSHHRFYMSLLPNRQDLIWHFAMPDGLLLAYDMTSKMLVGGIGPAGTLDDAELPARRFKTHPTWSHSNLGMLICFPDVVYKFIASERKLVEMFRAPEQERIISAGWVTRVTREVSQVAALAVRTNQGVWILDAERGIHSFVPLKKRDRANFSYTRVALFAEPDRFFAIDSDRPVLSPGELVEVAADGTELARRELPAFPVPHREPTLFMNLMGLVVPIGGYFVFGAIAAVSSPEAAEQFLTHWEEATAFYAALILSAAISSIVAYRVARIFAFTSAQRRAWTVLGVRLGPAGLLLQWSLVEWPAREPCHACGRSRVVNRPNCEHCLAPFPAPALDGTEVFEAAAVRTA